MKAVYFLIILLGSNFCFAQKNDPKVERSDFIQEMQDSTINKKDKSGLKQGIWKERNGNLLNEAYYKDDKKEGIVKVYYPDGMLNAIDEYQNGLRNGLSIELKNTGYIRKQCTYKNDVLEGRYKLFTNNGKTELEEYFVNGKLNGTKKVFYQNTKLQEESFYKNDKREGVTKWYNEQGKVTVEYIYVNGNLEGNQKTYYNDGILNSETTYKNNLMDGLYQEYHPDGKTIKMAGYYMNDKKTGTWKEYDLSSKLIATKKYKDDIEVK